MFDCILFSSFLTARSGSRKGKGEGGRRMRGHESKKVRGCEANTPSVEENRAVETSAAFLGLVTLYPI